MRRIVTIVVCVLGFMAPGVGHAAPVTFNFTVAIEDLQDSGGGCWEDRYWPVKS